MTTDPTDPNEALAELRKLADILTGHRDISVRAFAVAVLEYDKWLTAGNVGPRDWVIARARAALDDAVKRTSHRAQQRRIHG